MTFLSHSSALAGRDMDEVGTNDRADIGDGTGRSIGEKRLLLAENGECTVEAAGEVALECSCAEKVGEAEVEEEDDSERCRPVDDTTGGTV